MRVLLIIPTYQYRSYPMFLSLSDFPVGFAYLASALKKAGHEVFGLNPNNDFSFPTAYDMLHDKIECALKESQAELIGIGGLCTDYHFLKDAMKIVKKISPDIPIVCGGGIVTHDKDFIFEALSPDFCIIGEGERAIVELAGMLESGNREFKNINNLGYWKDGIPVFSNQNFKYGPIDEICFPDYEPFDCKAMLGEFQLANRNLYRYTRTNPRVMPFVAARGCPFSCTFCVHHNDIKYRARSIEQIIQEISSLYEQYDFNVLVFLDELFALNKERFKKMCQALINARKKFGWDFDWCFQAHASAGLNKDDFLLLKEAGCYLFGYGLESASPKILKSMNKKTKPIQISEGIKIANSAGIGYGGNLIFGDFEENIETIEESMGFFSKFCVDNHLFFANIQPYPGSKIFEICMEREIIDNKIDYYENIGKVYNMTSMPDSLWMLWVQTMLSLGNSFSWVKSSDASNFSKYHGTKSNPMAASAGKCVWNISVKCCHCQEEVLLRELLENDGQEKAGAFLAPQRNPLSIISRFHHYKKKTGESFLNAFVSLLPILIERIARKIIIALLGKRNNYFVRWLIPRIFKSLIPLMPLVGQKHEGHSFITGCPSCNKSFRVNIPYDKENIDER